MKQAFKPLVVAGALILASVAPLAAQPFQLYDGVEAVRAPLPAGAGFPAKLAEEYRRIALFEADEMVDWVDAEHFADKTLAAAGGESVPPERVDNWNVAESFLPALLSAEARLLRAYEKDARILAPRAAARAQAQFDCWVEQAEEGHQQDHIAACRSAFLNAMLEVDAVFAAREAARVAEEFPAK